MIRYTIFDRPGEHEHVASWRGRCTYCGHRVDLGHLFLAGWAPDQYDECTVFVKGEMCCRSEREHRAVRQTREQPWRIPSEIIGRYRAMRQPQPLKPYDVDEETDPDTLESLGLL